MTLLPHDNWQVRGVKLREMVKVGPKCANPDCTHWADHGHHIWRRSFIGGDHAWVELWDGTIVCNMTGLCWRCHHDITENRARIIYDDQDKHGPTFKWVDEAGRTMGPLRPQPGFRRLGAAGVDSPSSDPGNPGSAEAMQLTVDGGEVTHASVVESEDAAACPTCGRAHKRKHKEKLPPGAPRKKTRWQISVPQDAEEDGVDVLATLTAEAAGVIGREDQPIYFTLVEVLAFFLQHSHLLTREEVDASY